MIIGQLNAARRGGTCPPGCWPNTSGTCDCDYTQSTRALRGLGSTSGVALGVIAATGVALGAIHYFFPSHARRERRERNRRR